MLEEEVYRAPNDNQPACLLVLLTSGMCEALQGVGSSLKGSEQDRTG